MKRINNVELRGLFNDILHETVQFGEYYFKDIKIEIKKLTDKDIKIHGTNIYDKRVAEGVCAMCCSSNLTTTFSGEQSVYCEACLRKIREKSNKYYYKNKRY